MRVMPQAWLRNHHLHEARVIGRLYAHAEMDFLTRRVAAFRDPDPCLGPSDLVAERARQQAVSLGECLVRHLLQLRILGLRREARVILNGVIAETAGRRDQWRDAELQAGRLTPPIPFAIDPLSAFRGGCRP